MEAEKNRHLKTLNQIVEHNQHTAEECQEKKKLIHDIVYRKRKDSRGEFLKNNETDLNKLYDFLNGFENEAFNKSGYIDKNSFEPIEKPIATPSIYPELLSPICDKVNEMPATRIFVEVIRELFDITNRFRDCIEYYKPRVLASFETKYMIRYDVSLPNMPMSYTLMITDKGIFACDVLNWNLDKGLCTMPKDMILFCNSLKSFLENQGYGNIKVLPLKIIYDYNNYVKELAEENVISISDLYNYIEEFEDEVDIYIQNEVDDLLRNYAACYNQVEYLNIIENERQIGKILNELLNIMEEESYVIKNINTYLQDIYNSNWREKHNRREKIGKKISGPLTIIIAIVIIAIAFAIIKWVFTSGAIKVIIVIAVLALIFIFK
jgi:hypothetical protein